MLKVTLNIPPLISRENVSQCLMYKYDPTVFFKNGLHTGREQAGSKRRKNGHDAIVEGWRRLEINLCDYLNDVLSRLANCPVKKNASFARLRLEVVQGKGGRRFSGVAKRWILERTF